MDDEEERIGKDALGIRPTNCDNIY